MGCAVPSYFSAADQSLVKAEFDIVTAENDMKMEAISPTAGTYRFTAGDKVVAFAKANGMMLHGHGFVWYLYNPSWVDGTKAQMTAYIDTVTKHFKGNVLAWDVVNEPFQSNGTLRVDDLPGSINDLGSIYAQKQGVQYIDDAFKTTAKADPSAKLLLNEFDIEQVDAKFEGLFTKVKDLLGAGDSHPRRGLPDAPLRQLHTRDREVL